jgi:transposase
MGTITLSSKEARRPGVVQAAIDGKVTNSEGALALGISVRQFQRLKVRYRRQGLGGLAHGNRGKPSWRRLEAEMRQRVIHLLGTRYAGFNDHHFTEKLQEVEGISISRELVRRIRREGGIPAARRRRPTKHRHRRLREARSGALVLLDGSDFRWFGKDRSFLLGAIDDATGRILALHFRPHEDLHGYTELLRRIAGAYGLPLELYGDHLSVFVRNDTYWSLEEELAGVRKPTHFGQMLADLAIGYIAAGSPQAKGRIERLWNTLQDRLTNELRLRSLETAQGAEGFLPEFICQFNQRFSRPSRSSATVWRRPPRNLDQILGCRYERVVARDNTVTIPGRWGQIPPGPGGRSYHSCRVQVRELLDGRMLIYYQDRPIARLSAPEGTFTLVPRNNAHSMSRRRALGLDQPPKLKAPPLTPAETPAPWAQQRRAVTQHSPDHPWKKRRATLPKEMAGARTKSRSY